MGVEEVDLDDVAAGREQPPQVLESPDTSAPGGVGGAFERGDRVLLGEADQALQRTQAVDAAPGEERLGLGAGERTDQPAALEPIMGAALHAAAFVGVDVRVACGKAAGFRPGVQRDHFLTMIEDAHDPGLAADPHLAAEILRRHRVVSLVELDVTVAVHLAPGLGEAREERRGQGRERRPLRSNIALTCWRTVPWIRVSATRRSQSPRKRFCSASEANVRPRNALFWAYFTPASILPLCSGRAGWVGTTTVP